MRELLPSLTTLSTPLSDKCLCSVLREGSHQRGTASVEVRTPGRVASIDVVPIPTRKEKTMD